MSLIDTITRTMLIKPHPEGYPFILIAFAVTFVMLLVWKPLGFACLILSLFILYFFRDPVRAVPQKDGLVIAPADGRVISITEGVTLPDGLSEALDDEDTKFTKISIFLSVLDVHVNRTPITGEVVKTFYFEGKFLNAELDKASEENERALALIKTKNGDYIGMGQIAGLIARRIVTNLEEGKEVTAGERFGIIRFGSRADIYLPKNINPLICVGQRTLGGETVLADLTAKEETRIAELI